MAYGYDFPPYVPVAERRRRAARKLVQLRRKGQVPAPVVLAPRALIARTFWGQAWCDHLESYADYASRLPRGRSYVRNGSVIDLQIAKGEVRALVSGSDIYEVRIAIAPLAASRWKAVRKECAGQIGTIVELLSGRLSQAVMEKLCHRERGLFPSGRDMVMRCSCPDGARLCTHLAAVLYGVGARFDDAPELLFTLRGVDGAELIAAAGDARGVVPRTDPTHGTLATDDLAEIFGIDLAPADAPDAAKLKPGRPAPGKAKRKGAAPPRGAERRRDQGRERRRRDVARE